MNLTFLKILPLMFQFFCSDGFWKNCVLIFSIYSDVKKNSTPIVVPPCQNGFKNITRIYPTWRFFYTRFSYSGQMVYEKKIIKDFILDKQVFHCKTKIDPRPLSHCGPILPFGIMIWKKTLNFTTLMRTHKFQLFWSDGFWKEDIWRFFFIFSV